MSMPSLNMVMRSALRFFVAMAVSMIATACREGSAPEGVRVSFSRDWVMPLAADPQEEPTDDSLRIYAVNIIHDPPQDWTGYGVYLGRGLVITAAHVVGSAWQTKPSVRFGDLVLPAIAVKEGALDTVDLTLLRVEEQQLPVSLRLRRMPVCQGPPWIGEPVIVAIPNDTARSRIMWPRLLPAEYRERFSTVIRDVAITGNSGSGVFDAANKCLLGIISRIIMGRTNSESEPKGFAKYFVPAETIIAFIPSEYHF
jgi:S1-C subfamily serine protease